MARKTLTTAQTLKANGCGGFEHTVTRILSYWDRSTDSIRESGATWYVTDSAGILADLVALGMPSREHAAGVVSQLSPRTSWARNVAGAYAFANGGPDAARAIGCMGENVDRAARTLASADPLNSFGVRALKTANFARNLLGDSDAVTVDVWAARIAFPDNVSDPEKILKRVGVYNAIADAYREAAKRVGVTPATMQATTWIVARNGRAL